MCGEILQVMRLAQASRCGMSATIPYFSRGNGWGFREGDGKRPRVGAACEVSMQEELRELWNITLSGANLELWRFFADER